MTRNRLPAILLLFSTGVWAADLGGKLTIYIGGKPLASETYSLVKTDGKVTLKGSGNAELGTIKVAIEKFDVTEDGKYRPVSAEASAKMGQVLMAHSVTFDTGKAKDQINMGQNARTKEDDVDADVVVVNTNLPLFAWSILALRADPAVTGTQSFHAYILGQGETAANVVFQGAEEVQFAAGKTKLNHFTLTFTPSPTAEPISAEVFVNDDRRLIKIVVPTQNVEAYQEGYERIPPPEAKP